jgi:GTP cyclohydrolase I
MINNEDFFDEIGNNHIATNEETPLRADAFVQSDEEKIESIKADVEKILNTLGLDLQMTVKRHSNRVAKNVCERNGGLNPDKSRVLFDKVQIQRNMLVEKNIVVYSTCEHHLLPIVGRAHVAS